MIESRLILGDSRVVLASLDADSLDACVSDPPYELGFMGKKWDGTGIAFDPAFWRDVLRVLKPGAHLLACGGTRTYHRMASAIEDAGFEVRDCLAWLYASGFPKSLNLGEGLGTALKPAYEPVVLARKPFKGTVAVNVEQFGTGALNIETCRIGETVESWPVSRSYAAGQMQPGHVGETQLTGDAPAGRWPANVCLDDLAALVLDEMSGETGGSSAPVIATRARNKGWCNSSPGEGVAAIDNYGDSGGASRFFFTAKPSREERDYGCDGLLPKSAGEATSRTDGTDGLNSPRAGSGRTGGARNHHPTVKPVELMRWLVRLVTPPGGTVIDPFMGSGTTGMACKYEQRGFIGIEREPDYLEIATRRIAAVAPLFSVVDRGRQEQVDSPCTADLFSAD